MSNGGLFQGVMIKMKLVIATAMLCASIDAMAQIGGNNGADILYTIIPGARSANDAVIPISQSITEWEIDIDETLIDSSLASVKINIPDPSSKDGQKEYLAIRQLYRVYASGDEQWIGKIMQESGPEDGESLGETIINIIGGDPHGVITTENDNYQIYSDSNVGSRIAEVFLPDMSNDTGSVSSGGGSCDGDVPPSIPGVSNVEVLVLYDDDLDASTIQDRIIAEKLNMDAILALSGGQGSSGVPINFDIMGMNPIDIPDIYESVNAATYVDLTNEQNNTSLQLKSILNTSGADLLALYVPFDPDLGTGACGYAQAPSADFFDCYLPASFSLHASSCTTAQFVFFHELMHGVGSGHYSGDNYNPYYSYANGINIDPDQGIQGDEFSTLMACQGAQGQDPSETDCNRLIRLSDPDDTNQGIPIGHTTEADNVRFLTECQQPPGRCRREEVANRRHGVDDGDMPPMVGIETPGQDEFILPAGSYELTANVTDDGGTISTIEWAITDGSSQNTQVGTGHVSNGYSVITSQFNSPGEYLVSAVAVDSVNQVTTRSHEVTVIADGTDLLSETEYNPLPNPSVVRSRVTNLGPSVANDVVIRMESFSEAWGSWPNQELPSECSYVMNNSSGSNLQLRDPGTDPITPQEATIICNLDSLQPSESIEIEWDLCFVPLPSPTPPQPPGDPTLFINTIVVGFDGVDVDETNNLSSISQEPDLQNDCQ